MRRTALALMLCGTAFSMMAAYPVAPPSHPYAKAKVGDWMEYTVVTRMDGQEDTTSLRYTVIAKEARKIVVRMERKTRDAKTGKLKESKVDVPTPFDPWANFGKGQESWSFSHNGLNFAGQIEARGKENLVIQGQTISCNWVRHVVETEISESRSTFWRSAELPLDGLAKSRVESNGITMETTMIAFGRGK